MSNILYQKTKEFLEEVSTSRGVTTVSGALFSDGAHGFSIGIDCHLDSACLCAEVGNICDAVKNGLSIKESICLKKVSDKMVVLPPCGLCLERFALFGDEVLFGVQGENDLHYKSLQELAPIRWYEKL